MSETTTLRPLAEPIKVEFYLDHSKPRTCTVCGEFTTELAESASGDVRVCYICIEVGDIDRHLQRNAAHLLRQWESIKALVGRIQAPTFSEWEAMRYGYEPEVVAGPQLVTDRDPSYS